MANPICDTPQPQLADALKANCCITSLDLSGNHISDEGATALASMLSSSGAPELIELDLRDNPLSPPALSALVRAPAVLAARGWQGPSGQQGERLPRVVVGR